MMQNLVMQNLAKFRASVLKEARIILRDRQALILFFTMPVIFVLILSLSLRDVFGDRPGASFPVLLVAQDQAEVGREIVATFRANRSINLALSHDASEAQVRQWLIDGRYRFAVLVPAGATDQAKRRLGEIMADVPLDLRLEKPVQVQALADPALRSDYRKVLEGTLSLALHGIEMKLGREQLEQTLRVTQGERFRGLPDLEQSGLFAPVHGDTVTRRSGGPTPSSVQQNAPAWTLLAMFFLAVPLSVSFIKEREQGSLFRLQTMSVPAWVVLGGKAIPFFVINQIQMVSVLAVSVFVLPLLGGDPLGLGDSPLALILMGASASLAAIGFGIAVAMYARTTEQAAGFSSATVMIMGALGGILVPKAVMLPIMQNLAVISPLSWGLDGFLDVFVRGGGVREVLPEALALLTFAAICHAFAILRYRRRV